MIRKSINRNPMLPRRYCMQHDEYRERHLHKQEYYVKNDEHVGSSGCSSNCRILRK